MPKLGYITASRFKDVMTNGRKKDSFGETAMSYLDELTINFFGVEMPQIKSEATDHGIRLEEQAIAEYTHLTGNVPYNPGFQSIEGHFIGGTTDGLIGDDGMIMIEVKCPKNPINHFRNLMQNLFVTKYYPQVQGYLWITGRKSCTMVSYDQRFPDLCSQLYLVDVPRDDDYIEVLSRRVFDFEKMLIDNVFQAIEVVEKRGGDCSMAKAMLNC